MGFFGGCEGVDGDDSAERLSFGSFCEDTVSRKIFGGVETESLFSSQIFSSSPSEYIIQNEKHSD
jgi:hypothetical protein